jgi:hypothetical protein
MAHLSLILAALTIALAMPVPSSPGESDDGGFVKPLVGSTIPEVVRLLGKPIEAIPLRQTGGKLMIFETRQHDHYVIETDATGRVVDAAVKHRADQ